MKLKYAATNDGKTRHLVTRGHQLFRRLVGGFWQEQIHTGEFHNVISPDRVNELEAEFQRLELVTR